MNKSRWILVGMTALLLSFGLVLTGCPIDPANVVVTGVSLNKTSLTLAVGAAETLAATVTPDNATNKAVSWTSSAESVATVANGMVTAKSAGTATITVKTADGGFAATCTVTVTSGDAATPAISAQPQGASYTMGGAATALSVSATVDDGGTLSYQWYSNTVNSNSGGNLISGATNSSYTLTVPASGTVYYYVVVTNTNNNATSAKTAAVTSNVAAITVTGDDPGDTTNAATPAINTQPQGASYTMGVAATALSVSATVGDGGTLSYQWYSSTANSNTGGNPINGETQASYVPPTNASGTVYYYVVVTNTNNSVNGAKTAAVSSNAAAITVTGGGGVGSLPITVEGVTYTLKSVPAGTVTSSMAWGSTTRACSH